MARSISISISISKPYLTTTTRLTTSSSPLRYLSSQSSSDQPSDNSSTSVDPLIKKLEDAIHQIIVRRSAPDWLPFRPGSSYWVPPRKSNAHGLAKLFEQLSVPPNTNTNTNTNTNNANTIKRNNNNNKIIVLDNINNNNSHFQNNHNNHHRANGWPSSDYFVQGGAQHPVDLDSLSNKVSKPEDEEG